MGDVVPVDAGGVAVPDETPQEAYEKLQRELTRQMREPFKRALQRLLKFRPTDDALQKFANKSPDRWAQAISILGNLSGYQPGINVAITVKNVHEMSDAELLAENHRLSSQVAALARGVAKGEVVDAEIVHPSPATSGESK